MRILIILTILLLGGCASDYEARERADNLHDARVSIRNQCGTDAACVDKMKNAYFQPKERTAAPPSTHALHPGWTPERKTEAEYQPKYAPMNDPTAYVVGTQEIGAQYFPDEPRSVVPPSELPEGYFPPAQQLEAAPAAQPSPAATLAQVAKPPAERKIPKGWTKERMDEADELNALGKRLAQQYRAAKRPVFRLKFRHQYPTMSKEEIEILVNDAVEEGLQEAMQKEEERLFGGPVTSPPVRPPISCTSYQLGMFTNTDCY